MSLVGDAPRWLTPLDGYRVVELSEGLAGAYCTKFLCDGGAEVVKVEGAGGDPLRRVAHSVPGGVPDGSGALFRYLAEGKRSVVLDLDEVADFGRLRSLVESADAIVWSSEGYPARHVSAAALRGWNPDATVVALSPFGLDGPWSQRPASDLTLQAWCGGMGDRGSPLRPPVSAGASPAGWMSGMFAAVGLLASRYRAKWGGPGELVDVSMLESLVLTQTMYPATFLSIAGRPLRSTRSVNFPAVERTRDGWVGFMLVTGQQWLDFCVMVERDDWLADSSLISLGRRIFRREELAPAIGQWMSQRSTDEIIELATAYRIPVAPVGTGASVPEFDHFVAGDFFVRNIAGGFVEPNVPHRWGGTPRPGPVSPAPALGEAEPQTIAATTPSRAPAGRSPESTMPFEGLRVADFTAFWAGPIVGHVLAMWGAEVIHIESPHRPDGMRSTSTRSFDEDEWWEWAPLFHGGNTNKLSLGVDLNRDEGRDIVRQLLESCDVVVENFSPRVMEQWNLSYDDIKAIKPDIIMLRMPAFGVTGPWRDRVGYAQTMEQISGLAWVTGYPDEEPQVPNGPCDPIAGSHATIALLMALEHRRRSGEGMLIESPMIAAALAVAAQQVVEFTAYGVQAVRDGNRGGPDALQNAFLTADVGSNGRCDRWVAIAVESDDQWTGLRAALGDPAWAADTELATHQGRIRERERIEAELREWCRIRTSDDVVAQLWPQGVPVGKVLRGFEQQLVPQLEARGFWERVEHPVTGPVVHCGYPARLSSEPRQLNRRAAPTVGQDNHDVLTRLVGIDADRIEQLEVAGVIGTGPRRPSTPR